MNQNRCSYRTGSPPADGSKNDELKFRAVNSIVIAPADTGNEINSNTAVIRTDQQNKGIFSIVIADGRIIIIVEMKLIAPRIDPIRYL